MEVRINKKDNNYTIFYKDNDVTNSALKFLKEILKISQGKADRQPPLWIFKSRRMDIRRLFVIELKHSDRQISRYMKEFE